MSRIFQIRRPSVMAALERTPKPTGLGSLARAFSLTLCLCASAAFAQGSSPPVFSLLLPAGPLSTGSTSLATGIGVNPNNAANNVSVVGASTMVTTAGKDAAHAFLYSGALPPLDLGTLAGPTGLLSVANAINGTRVVGYSHTKVSLLSPIHATLWNNGTMTDLGTLAGPSGPLSVAYAVNNAGLVVGSSLNAQSATHAFVYNSASATPVMRDMGVLDSTPKNNFSVAYALNANGQVVGNSMKGNDLHAFIVDSATSTSFAMRDLGKVGGPALPPPTPGTVTGAFGINNSGQVVGSRVVGSGSTAIHAFSVDSANLATIKDLGVIGGYVNSQANAINDSGQIVGTLYTVAKNAPLPHAFIYQNNTMYDLNARLPSNATNWTLNTASAIDNAGNISGIGTFNGKLTAFVLVPLTLTSISPNTGPAAGGTSVILTGTGFTEATTVNFGTTSAAFTRDKSTQITAIVPAGSPGSTVPVNIVTQGATSNAVSYTYAAAPAAPVITSLNPSVGPIGAQISINGSGFTNTSFVRFRANDQDFSNALFSVVNDGLITATVPNVPLNSSEDVDVIVVTNVGTSNRVPFTYTDVGPVITRVTSNARVDTGGTVTVEGSGFSRGAFVELVHPNIQLSSTVISDTLLTFVAPSCAIATNNDPECNDHPPSVEFNIHTELGEVQDTYDY